MYTAPARTVLPPELDPRIGRGAPRLRGLKKLLALLTVTLSVCIVLASTGGYVVVRWFNGSIARIQLNFGDDRPAEAGEGRAELAPRRHRQPCRDRQRVRRQRRRGRAQRHHDPCSPRRRRDDDAHVDPPRHPGHHPGLRRRAGQAPAGPPGQVQLGDHARRPLAARPHRRGTHRHPGRPLRRRSTSRDSSGSPMRSVVSTSASSPRRWSSRPSTTPGPSGSGAPT